MKNAFVYLGLSCEECFWSNIVELQNIMQPSNRLQHCVSGPSVCLSFRSGGKGVRIVEGSQSRNFGYFCRDTLRRKKHFASVTHRFGPRCESPRRSPRSPSLLSKWIFSPNFYHTWRWWRFVCLDFCPMKNFPRAQAPTVAIASMIFLFAILNKQYIA